MAVIPLCLAGQQLKLKGRNYYNDKIYKQLILSRYSDTINLEGFGVPA